MAGIDFSRYEAGRRGIMDEYAGKRAANEFGRFTSQQRFKRNKDDFNRGYRRGQAGFMNNWAQRGLTGGGVRSGSFQDALRRRTTDYTRGLGRMEQDQRWAEMGYDQGDAQIEQMRINALNDLEMAKQRDIAMAALNINALRPIIGG